MLTVSLPADLSRDVQARAVVAGTTSDDVVVAALRREARSRELFGDILDAAGSDLDEDELMALAVATVRQVRQERAAR